MQAKIERLCHAVKLTKVYIKQYFSN